MKLAYNENVPYKAGCKVYGIASNCVVWLIHFRVLSRHEQYHLFYPNTNTQYFQTGLNNTQYQYQFFDESLTIPNTNIHEQS